MSYFNNLRLKAAVMLAPGLTRSMSMGRFKPILTGNTFTALDPRSINYIRAYEMNPFVFAVQDWKSSKAAAAPAVLFKQKDAQKFAEYNSLRKKNDPKALREIRKIKSEAVDEVRVHPILKLINKPNQLQTREQLFADMITMHDILGTTFLYGNRLQAGVNTGKLTELFKLTEHNMMVEGLTKFTPATQYRPMDMREPIPGSDVVMMQRHSPMAHLQCNWILGLSRLQPITQSVLAKYIAATEAEGEIFQNRGVRDLIFPDSDNYDDAAADALAQARKDFNETMETKSRFLAFSTRLGSIKVGSSPVDLAFGDAFQRMFEEVCRVYHVDSGVIGAAKESTFNNIGASRKTSLIDGVLPDQAYLYQTLNSFVCGAWNNDKDTYFLEPDLDHYPELQDEQLVKAQFLSLLPVTGDEFRDAFGYDAIGTPEMQVVTMPGGRVPVSDLLIDTSGDPANDGTY